MIVPVILSGGSGTRLWPLSLPERPKQFLPLAGPDSMFAATLARATDGVRFSAPIIVGAARHAVLIEEALPASGWPDARIILEPMPRGTAAAIALAALAVPAKAMLLIMPSDHVIADVPAFLAATDRARTAAEQGWLVTFGIQPDAPETGFGYIRLGTALDTFPGVHAVDRFIEKPPQAEAEAMLAAGGHAWNAGIFLMRAGTLIEALEEHAPEVLVAARGAIAKAQRTDRLIAPHPGSFAEAPDISIDYAVMERAERVAVVPTSCGWSDVGSWDALHAIGDKDDTGNRIEGEAVLIDSSNCLVHADGIRIAASGVRDLIIVATRDQIMIVPRGQSQDVKGLSAAAAEAAAAKNRQSPD